MKSLATLALIVLILGCVNNVQVEKGDKVAVDYTGKLENGTIFDSSSSRGPLEFTAGAGQMIKGFDSSVIGMKINESKTITIPPEDAYGAADPKNIIEVPISNVPNGTKAGDTLYARGQPVRVIKVTNETATIDANHPLAGKTLIFDITVVRIEKSNKS